MRISEFPIETNSRKHFQKKELNRQYRLLFITSTYSFQTKIQTWNSLIKTKKLNTTDDCRKLKERN